jgi:methylenetetrahydrofolate dehydrogenase (NADP+)/methenyltetrahydrofolate cyclohydrolase
MIKISGREIASKILNDLKSKPVPKNFLAVFLVGNDPSSVSFIDQKEKIAKELGVDFRIYKLEEASKDKLKEKITQVVSSKKCGGAVIQLPLPGIENPQYVLNAILPKKDVDVLSERSLGSVYSQRTKILPPAASVANEIFKYLNIELSFLHSVAVVGQGVLVGKPISSWLSGKVSEVFILSKGSNFGVLKNADIVISGTGDVGLIKASMLKKSAGVIDFGYGADENGKVKGDFDEESLKKVDENYLSFYTPTPGGTGPILVACLFKNFYTLNSED